MNATDDGDPLTRPDDPRRYDWESGQWQHDPDQCAAQRDPNAYPCQTCYPDGN
jgi:hypothetical protein